MWTADRILAWIGMVVVVASVAALFRGLRGVAATFARCAGCGYEMTGVPEVEGVRRCPECGRVPRSERELWKAKIRWAWLVAGVLAFPGGVGMVQYGMGERGWPAVMPTWVLTRCLPMVEDDVGRVEGRAGRWRSKGWAADEMAIRVLQEEVDASEVCSALVRVGAIDAPRWWPKGAMLAAAYRPVSWLAWDPMVKTRALGDVALQLNPRGEDDQSVYAGYVPVERAAMGMDAIVFEVGIRSQTWPGLRYSRVALACEVLDGGITPAPDASEEMTARVSAALRWNGLSAEGVESGVAGPVVWGSGWSGGWVRATTRRLTLAIDTKELGVAGRVSVEIEVDVDRGLGWEPIAYVPGGDYEPAGRVVRLEGGREVKLGQVIALAHGWPRGPALRGVPQGLLAVAEWKFRLRGVMPTGEVRWPRPRYWAGEIVVERADLAGGW